MYDLLAQNTVQERALCTTVPYGIAKKRKNAVIGAKLDSFNVQ